MAECCSTCACWRAASFGKHGFCMHVNNLGTAPATGKKLPRGTRADDYCELYQRSRALPTVVRGTEGK